jgi:two-component system sensor histidine kinase KdpD
MSDAASLGWDTPSQPGARANNHTVIAPWAQYAVTMMLVALATGGAFLASQLVDAPNVTLVFVLPVVVAASVFGMGPAVAASLLGVAAFDFFFTRPYYSFTIESPSDIWAAVLLLTIAAIVSGVAAQSRAREIAARRSAAQAAALQELAHTVLAARSTSEILQAGAKALYRIFRGPAVVVARHAEAIEVVAREGGAKIGPAELAAAKTALDTQLHVAGRNYPHDNSAFDFWPIRTPTGCNYLLGVDLEASDVGRADDAARLVELLGGYLPVVRRRQAD